MKYLTAQQIFDRVTKHLLTQKKKAHNKPDGVCLYWTRDGLKCAIGALILEKYYSPHIEGATVLSISSNPTGLDSIALKKALRLSGISLAPKDLLSRLQRVHDNRPPQYWKGDLEEIAIEHNLEFDLPAK